MHCSLYKASHPLFCTATDKDNRMVVETFGNYQSVLASEVRYRINMSTPSHKGFVSLECYCFSQLPFGILSAPEHFQRRLNERFLQSKKLFFALRMASSSLAKTRRRLILVSTHPYERSGKLVLPRKVQIQQTMADIPGLHNQSV